MSGVRRLLRGRPTIHLVLALTFLPWLALLGWLASVGWFITDDAFISFRYVRNLLEGHGLVFNPGEYVEGYTNFLWVLELAAIWGLLGIRPEDAAQWLSVIYTAGTIVVMLWWVARMPALRHRWLVAWMALGLVCSSATFAVWTSGGGLETRQFTFFALVCCCLPERVWPESLGTPCSLPQLGGGGPDAARRPAACGLRRWLVRGPSSAHGSSVGLARER